MVIVNTWNDALFVAKDAECKEVFVIGGGVIFKEVINKADRIYMTRDPYYNRWRCFLS
ncbi:MAG: dihydrofolate reductase [Segetibacter sp.]